MLYPQGGTQPLVSTLNYVAGETVANAAIVPLGSGGLTVVAGVAGTDVILDVDGYFADSMVHVVPASDTFFVGLGASNVSSTAVGYGALATGTFGGGFNTAVGQYALTGNLSGGLNTAIGATALQGNTSGSQNTVVGSRALETNDAGSNNTAVGYNALAQNTAGTGNIALGSQAGAFTTGNHNIAIGHVGAASESDTIRLGDGHQRTFIAGIRGVTPPLGDEVAVVINSAGQLGAPVPASTRRAKTQIADIGERSQGVQRLRPVSFHYRAQPDGPLQYGLIAEELAEVYPELVVRDAEGAPETVRYHLLPALLLSELQRQAAEKDRQLAELAATVAELAARLARLERASSEAAERGGRDR
jgi:Chaperone of endosialidase